MQMSVVQWRMRQMLTRPARRAALPLSAAAATLVRLVVTWLRVQFGAGRAHGRLQLTPLPLRVLTGPAAAPLKSGVLNTSG